MDECIDWKINKIKNVHGNLSKFVLLAYRFDGFDLTLGLE